MFRVCNIFGDDIKLDSMHNVKNKKGHDFLLSLIGCVLPYVTTETQSFKRNNFQSYQSCMNIACAKDLLWVCKNVKIPQLHLEISSQIIWFIPFLLFFFWLWNAFLLQDLENFSSEYAMSAEVAFQKG